jgi:hypothetical protein
LDEKSHESRNTPFGIAARNVRIPIIASLMIPMDRLHCEPTVSRYLEASRIIIARSFLCPKGRREIAQREIPFDLE